MNRDGGAPTIEVEVIDRQSDACVDVAHLRDLLAASLADQGVRPPAEVGLSIVDAREMADLNRDHMGGNGPTDVLAFPIDGGAAPPQGQPAVIGDIVVCPSVADRAPQALGDELALLVVHGALHLLGHDHADPVETAEMQRLEQRLLDRFHRAR